MSEAQRKAWQDLAEAAPWLNASHRAHLSITTVIYARLTAGEDVGVQALNLLRQCLGQIGATPADASRVTIPAAKSDDPADEFFG